MSIRNLDLMFAPKSVALIGASAKEGSVGNVLMNNLLAAGLSGPVWGVNPRGGEIAGCKAFEDVASLPEAPDLAVIATPPQTVPGLIDELGRRGTKAAVVITAAAIQRWQPPAFQQWPTRVTPSVRRPSAESAASAAGCRRPRRG